MEEAAKHFAQSGGAARRLLSLVVPVQNESQTVPLFWERTQPVLAALVAQHAPFAAYEAIFVDDGSEDRTRDVILGLRRDDAGVKLLSLSRRFGKDVALSAGIDFAEGDAVIPMDVDLQDPPECIPELVAAWQAGYDVVNVVRTDRSTDSPAKRWSAKAFYKTYNFLSRPKIVENAGDFRLIDRRVVIALRRLPEKTRFMKGLFAWVGFRQTRVFVARAERVSGRSKWGALRLWSFALDGITSASTFPLRVWSYLGLILAALSLLYAVFLVGRVLIYGVDVPGYASLATMVLFFGGLNLLTLGILGEYVGRVYSEVKGRPLYLLGERVGFDAVDEGGVRTGRRDARGL